MLATTSLSAHAAVLSEWPLPAGSQPLQIDASSPSRRIYFVDQALSTINQLDGGASVLTSWPAPFTPSVPGSIVVDRFAATRFVYVTDLPGTVLGQLDIITNIYFQYDLTLLPWNISGGPRQLVYDNSYSVEPNDDVVWFSASGDPASGSAPLIGYLPTGDVQVSGLAASREHCQPGRGNRWIGLCRDPKRTDRILYRQRTGWK